MDLLSTGPLAVFRANVDLAMRLEELRQQWQRAGHGPVADVPPMSPAAALPAQAMWRHLHRQYIPAWPVAAPSQAQRAYAEGVHQAVQTWQRSVSQLMMPSVVQGGPVAVAMVELTAVCWGLKPLN